MKTIDVIVGVLLIIGGLNWGLVGLFDFNVVEAIFGSITILSRIVYVLVGLAALYDLVSMKAICSRWELHFNKPSHA